MALPEEQARKELGERFNSAVTDHPEVMAECLSMMRIYNISPTDLFFKYEAFLMSRPSGLRAKLSTLTVESAKELRREIQREHQAKAVASSASEVTPKASVGVRKTKGPADLGVL
jgi:DNA polymerase alpha subunit B